MNKQRLLRTEALGNKYKDEAKMKKLGQLASFGSVAADTGGGRRQGCRGIVSARGARSSGLQPVA
jgi:hypothetical protein